MSPRYKNAFHGGSNEPPATRVVNPSPEDRHPVGGLTPEGAPAVCRVSNRIAQEVRREPYKLRGASAGRQEAPETESTHRARTA